MKVESTARRPARSLRALYAGLLAGIIVPVCSGVLAQQGLDLATAFRHTLANNSELAAYPYEQRRNDALKEQANIRPLPRIGLEVENVLGSGNFEGLDLSEFTLVFSQLIELGGKREQRVGVADADKYRITTEYELAKLDVLAETSRRYYALLRIQALQDLIEVKIVEERGALDVIRSRAGAGAVGQADVSRMSLRLGRSQALQHQLDDAAALARIRLAAMWNGGAEFTRVVGNIAEFPELPANVDPAIWIDQSPSMMNRVALQRLADNQVLLAEANGRSDPELGLGLRHFNLTDDQALVFTLRMPLAFRNPNVGRIEAARIEADLSMEKSRLLRRKLELALLEIQQVMISYRAQAGRIESNLLPQAEALLEDTREGYENGRYSVLQWVDAQKERYDLEVELIEARSQVYLQLLELERITGAALAGPGAGEV